MDSLYILEPGCYLRREGRALVVHKDGERISRIPAENLKSLVVVGYASLSGAVLDFLIQNRVETVFVTPTGRFRARLALDEHKHVNRRRSQYLRLSDKTFAQRTAALIVAAKARNMAAVLQRRAARFESEHLRPAAARIGAVRLKVELAKDIEAIRGFEGAATRIYYEAFRHLVRTDDFRFSGRSRRPPLDPINALLSFVYTLLTNEVLSAIKTVGLDPYLGALHDVEYGRPSLACDLVEEYRSILGDRLVLTLINRRMVKPADFVVREPIRGKAYAEEAEMTRQRPVEMKPETMRTFIAAYEEMMNRTVGWGPDRRQMSYRRVVLQQVRRFGEYLENPERVYTPVAPEM